MTSKLKRSLNPNFNWRRWLDRGSGKKLNIRDAMAEAANKKSTSVSMQTLLDTGRGKRLPDGYDSSSIMEQERNVKNQIASFLYREMPVRFSHRARELARLPHGLNKQPSIKEVENWYCESFDDIVKLSPPSTEADEAIFMDTLDNIYKRHAETQVTIAKGLREFSFSPEIQKTGKKLYEFEDIHKFLDKFSTSRIGIRMLIGQYLEIENSDPDYVGLISINTSPVDVANQAIDHARFMCEREFGDSPMVSIRGRKDLTFAYVPSHLYYMLFELLKNSMRATCDMYMDEDGMYDGELPDINIIIADGEENEDVVIKVSDAGGGIRRSHVSRIFRYLFTTVRDEPTTIEEANSDFGVEGPLAGLGYGLPISRAHARYFGGDLEIISMEGYGTDAFLYLSRLRNHSEPLM